jgi:hypothetical protein
MSINTRHVQCIVDKIASTLYQINDLSCQVAFLKNAETNKDSMEVVDEITALLQDIYDLDEKVYQYYQFIIRARSIFDRKGLEMEWQTVNFSEVERATAGRVIS